MTWLRSYYLDITWLIILLTTAMLATLLHQLSLQGQWMPTQLEQVTTIFISLIIEALPFLLIGILIAGAIQLFVTEEHVQRWIPKHPVLSVLMGCVVGSIFPACECGIVPIVRRLIYKGVPIPAALGFLLTGPLINPMVIFSTYMAFGQSLEMAGMRMGIGFVAACIIAFTARSLLRTNPFKQDGVKAVNHPHTKKAPFIERFRHMLNHSIDELFDVGKFFVLGALLAALMQTFVAAGDMLLFGQNMMSSTLLMMALAFLLSLCSEADAFIGASFSSIFPTTSILAFLIYGPMIDLKNTLMLLSVFKPKFVVSFVLLVTVIVACTVWLSALLFQLGV
ncbi:permease [Aureibacillus halotolerans]|uniref:Permease n=1 Tax=Aureibacillus halotolerans TaxID=1508390 RepID=A0A4R6U956_9BACI|nr:permease [Aureibacillus halotolerans]TDQ41205.1 hypothetical protein EV213_104203 [Aureibacillus halotolerans]